MPLLLADLPTADRADLDRGRATDPVVRAVALAHVELLVTDLARAEAFYADFGLTPAERTPDALYLRAAGHDEVDSGVLRFRGGARGA